MRLVTWNVNSLRQRLPRVLEFVEEHAPDVLCLQETKSEAAAFPHAELAAAGYRAADHSGGRWAGVAILARDNAPPEDPARGLPGEPAQDECRWVEATIGSHPPVRVISTYVPNGRVVDSEWYAQKLDFLAAAAERVRELRATGLPLVVAGDMNVAPADVDVYDPATFADSTHVTPAERAALQALQDAGGLQDAFRHLHPDEQQFTWWDYRAGHFHKNLGLRIDLALVSDELAGRLTRAGMERPYRKGTRPSDHAPLLVEWTD
ncbi:MAG TPA: exodeoxyribonuclease III [Conexibacter sp.]|nr:exodeoxyribonuclease III [Conexibacter sp.]